MLHIVPICSIILEKLIKTIVIDYEIIILLCWSTFFIVEFFTISIVYPIKPNGQCLVENFASGSCLSQRFWVNILSNVLDLYNWQLLLWVSVYTTHSRCVKFTTSQITFYSQRSLPGAAKTNLPWEGGENSVNPSLNT